MSLSSSAARMRSPSSTLFSGSPVKVASVAGVVGLVVVSDVRRTQEGRSISKAPRCALARLRQLPPARRVAFDREYDPAVKTGTASPAPNPRGRFVEGSENFLCRYCHSYVQAPPGKGLRECTTPGWKRPTGVGAFATLPRLLNSVREPSGYVVFAPWHTDRPSSSAPDHRDKDYLWSLDHDIRPAGESCTLKLREARSPDRWPELRRQTIPRASYG